MCGFPKLFYILIRCIAIEAVCFNLPLGNMYKLRQPRDPEVDTLAFFLLLWRGRSTFRKRQALFCRIQNGSSSWLGRPT